MSQGQPRCHHAIDAYSFFQGVLYIAGWVHVPGATVRSLDLVLPSGSVHRLRSLGIPSADVAELLFPAATHARFGEAVHLPVAIGEVVGAELRVHLARLPPITIERLGDPGADPSHALLAQFREVVGGQATGRMLEVGSRARSGLVRRHLSPPGWDYVGLDVHAGPNVDRVGDAHRLSSLFPAAHFDAVMAFSVLEHLLMPWKFVIELNRVLRVGATGLFTTHQTWPLHDQPWDFWRFSDKAWAGLLNAATGFEIVDARMGEPCYVVASKCHAAVAFDQASPGALSSLVLFRKTGETTLEWPVELEAVVGTHYPTTTSELFAGAPV